MRQLSTNISCVGGGRWCEPAGDFTACSSAGGLSAQRWLTILGILLLVLSGFSAAAEPNTKNVLVVFSALDRQHETLDLMKSGVRAHFPGPVNFSVVYLDYQRLGQESYRESLAATLRLGYREAKPDVLIVSSIQAIQFITQYRDKIFPGVPIVFTAVSTSELQGLKMLPGMTGRQVLRVFGKHRSRASSSSRCKCRRPHRGRTGVLVGRCTR